VVSEPQLSRSSFSISHWRYVCNALIYYPDYKFVPNSVQHSCLSFRV
jgi:hypothetical protein